MNWRLTFAGLLRSEWIKLWTVRSTYWCLAIVVVLAVLLSLLVSSTAQTPDPSLTGAELTNVSTSAAVSAATLGLVFAQLVIAVLGALVLTGEFGSGMIRTTFIVAPRRLGALLAKALVFAVVTFVIGWVSELVATLVSVARLQGRGYTPDLGDPGYWWALLGGAGFLALAGVFAMAIGACIRNSAASIATAVGVLFVLPLAGNIVVSIINADWIMNVITFLPSSAGGQMYAYGAVGGTTDGLISLSSWEGTLVVAAWTVVFGVIGLVLAKRRDV